MMTAAAKENIDAGQQGNSGSLGGGRGTLLGRIPPGHLRAYQRLKLPAGSTIMLGGFAFLEKGVGFTDIGAPKCSSGCPTAWLLVNNSLGGALVASRTFSWLLWTCLGKASGATRYIIWLQGRVGARRGSRARLHS